MAVLFGDKIRSQSKPFLYLFQLVAAKDPVHDGHYATQESGHGRRETRLCIASQDLSPLGDLAFEWSKLSTIG
ncbi:hypothetical protein ACEUBD_20810, partial [Aeromonas veronii]